MKIYLDINNVIVVGGSGGIGNAIVQKLLDEGAKNVVIASRNVEKINESIKLLKFSDNQNVFPLKFDINDIKNHSYFIKQCNSLLNKNEYFQGLVIASGRGFSGKGWRGFDVSSEEWDSVINTNLKSPFFLIKNFTAFINKNHITGKICVVSSISAHRDLLSPYQVSKSALSGIVRAYGKYLKQRGIIINCIEPGRVFTEMMKWLSKYTDGVRKGDIYEGNNIGRTIRAEEIAALTFILISNLAESLSGSCIVASGGEKSLLY